MGEEFKGPVKDAAARGTSSHAGDIHKSDGTASP